MDEGTIMCPPVRIFRAQLMRFYGPNWANLVKMHFKGHKAHYEREMLAVAHTFTSQQQS